MRWSAVHREDGLGGDELCHSRAGSSEVMQDSSPPQDGDVASSVLGPPRCLPAPLMGRYAPGPSTYLTRPQERPADAAAPARAPRLGAQPPAQPAPRPGRPRVPELRRAAAAGHGVVCAGAGGAAAARAPGGGGAGAYPTALADRAVAPSAGPIGAAPRNPPRSRTRLGLRARPATAVDWSQGLRSGEAPLAQDREGLGASAGCLSRPGPGRQLARPGPPALLYPDAHHSILGSDLSEGARPS